MLFVIQFEQQSVSKYHSIVWKEGAIERNDIMARKDNKGRNLHVGESQRKDGLYMFRYTNPRTGTRGTIYANDLPELRQKEKQIQKDIDDCIITDAEAKNLTLNGLYDIYLRTSVLKANTRNEHMKLWNNHVKDTIGNIRVVQLRSSNIKMLYAEMSNKNYAYSTIKAIHNLIHPALELAVEDDLIRKNPAKKALLRSYGTPPKEKMALSTKQQEIFFDFIERSNVYSVYQPMFTILIEIGLRCGELIGLTWDDIDMKNRVISINHQLIYKDYGDGYKFRIVAPKTDSGIRDIPMTDKVYKALQKQKEYHMLLGRPVCESIDGYSNFVFVAKTGRPLMPSAVNNALYNIIAAYNNNEEIMAKAEHREPNLLPKFSVHCLRHTACSNMARQGMNLKVLQYIMGHANCDITMDVYNHITDISDIENEVRKIGVSSY